MEEKRNNIIDIAKGIGIICVILGHLGVYGIVKVVYTFHMPLFFYISGFLLNQKTNFYAYVKNKFLSLMKPYATASILIVIFSMIMAFSHGADYFQAGFAKLITALYGGGYNQKIPFKASSVGAIWFLWALFWSSLTLKYLSEKKQTLRICTVIILFLFATISKDFIWLPFCIQSGFFGLLFMYFGFLYKDIHRSIFPHISQECKMVIMLILSLCWVWCIINFKDVALYRANVYHGIIDIVGSIGGCLCVFILSGYISHYTKVLAQILSWLGVYSVLILIFDILGCFYINWHSLLTFFNTLIPIGKGFYAYLVFRIIGKFFFCFGLAYLVTRSAFLKSLFGIR